MTGRLKHWVWLNTEPGLPDDEWKQRLARMKQAGISAILPEIFDNHKEPEEFRRTVRDL